MKDFFMLINRNLFKKLKRSILLTALVVLGVNMAQAQRLSLADPTQPNSEQNPYEIKNEGDWNNFVLDINDGYAYYDAVNKKQQYVRLKKHISVTTMAGTDSKKFKGIFDGNCDTLTFNFTNTTSDFSGPFCFIDGVIIKNLYVDGTITTNKKHAGGIAGKASGKNTIINCTSNITISGTGAEGHGGFIGRQVSGTTQFEKSLFCGVINGATTVKCAGFIGWLESERANYDDNCLMAGTISIQKNYSTFHRTINGKTTCNGKYTKNLNIGSNNTGDNHTNPGPNGFPANTTYTGIARKYKVGEVNYYAQVDIDDLNDMFLDPEHPLVITTNYYGKRLKEGEDYDVQIEKKTGSDPYQTISVGEMVADAQYRVTVTAKGDYVGSKTWEYKILSDDARWNKLQKLIDDAGSDPVVLVRDYMGTPSDNALIIDKDLTLNLNNHTIDRYLKEPVANGQVIRISAGKNVTISNGTITGGYSRATDDDSDPKTDKYDYKNDAGGIYNMGNLVLNNVNVVGNKCIKYTDKPDNDAATARGGGVYTGSGSSFTMTGGKVSRNEAKGGGGGVYCYMPSSFSMRDVEISHNDSESKGGGLRIRTAAAADTACLVNCRIESNRATEIDLTRGSDGGGVYMQEGLLKMVKCTIGGAEGKGNQSAFAGAGFYQMGGYTRADSCTITHNSAYTEHDRMYGGGICIKAGTYLMDSGSITDNHSYRDGGGVYIYHGAHFKVKGRVTINDNLRTRPGAVPENTENNAYTDDGALIEIVGPLTSDSRIHITGHGFGGTYTKGKDTYNVPDSVIVPDGKYQLVTVDEQGNDYPEVVLAPYEWYQPGAWGDDGNGNPNPAPTIASTIVINRAIELEPGEIGYADYIRYVNGSIVLKDGSQLICKDGLMPNSPPVEALFEKKIKGVEESDGGWYAISIPTDGVKIWDLWEHNTNLVNKTSESGTDDDMDLLRYDEEHHFWDSYTDGTGNSAHSWLGKFTNTENGRGYLYRNRSDKSLNFYGFINLGDVTYKVYANSDDVRMKGWNIIGNPYTHGIYKGEGTAIPNGDLLNDNFYTLTKEGGWTPARDNVDSIGVCQGILVSAKATGDLVMHSSISKAAPAPSKNDGEKTVKNSIKFTVSNSQYEEKAYVLFDKGTGLRKVDHLNEDIPMLYIRHNNEDYAIASVGDNAKSVNLEFWAKTLSAYTMNIDIEGEFRYLHLIDKITGDDIDLLVENKYKFIGAATDDTDRFIVLMDYASDSETEGFAYQNGNDIIVCGEGELQMFDVAGRLVSTQYVSGVEAVRKPSLGGVYILRLLGTDVKTQKIVVK